MVNLELTHKSGTRPPSSTPKVARCRCEAISSLRLGVYHVSSSAPPKGIQHPDVGPASSFLTLFQASESWSNLGGSAAAAEYLKQKQQEQAEASLVLRKDCTESEIRAATKTCAKYLKNILNQDVFADCVFDVCHGGGEAEAKRAALLFSG